MSKTYQQLTWITGWLLIASLSVQPVRAQTIEFSCQQPLQIENISQTSKTLIAGNRFELSFDLKGRFENPFDPDQIDVICEFDLPDNRTVRVLAFFYVPYQQDDQGRVAQSAAACWKVRYTPLQAGDYSWHFIVHNRQSSLNQPGGRFKCIQETGSHFIMKSSVDPHRLALDSGQTYIPLGINLAYWTLLGKPIPEHRLRDTLRWMNRLADAGGNFVRLRADSWWYAIEMCSDQKIGYQGIGWYHPQTCWEIDQIYELADKRGLYLIHCLYNANGLVNSRPDPQPHWKQHNCFLQENGGPCVTKENFWISEQAKKYVRQYLRYCVARWGYSTHLMSWEFFNELLPTKEQADKIFSWHRQMARYLKQQDPNPHLISSSLLWQNMQYPFDAYWQLDELDFIQIHVYHAKDIPSQLAKYVKMVYPLAKPVFFGEVGVIQDNTAYGQYDYDLYGTHLHNILWGSIAAGACGAGAFWFVETYLDKHNLYNHYKPLRNWIDRFDWQAAKFEAFERVKKSSKQLPAIRLMGQKTNTAAWFWIQNLDSNWQQLRANKPIEHVSRTRMVLTGFDDGTYELQWWDTWKGGIVKKSKTSCLNGQLPIDIPAFYQDIAGKIVRKTIQD